MPARAVWLSDLESLCLDAAQSRLTDAAVAALAAGCPRLTGLSLCGAARLTDNALTCGFRCLTQPAALIAGCVIVVAAAC